mmetsp:Transcript_102037/g.288114  ORF Transcript_102037/g.288114 Transcript_102037/m.288114 type:complete len:264 (+) Transcript_102037:661-1452(+)
MPQRRHRGWWRRARAWQPRRAGMKAASVRPVHIWNADAQVRSELRRGTAAWNNAPQRIREGSVGCRIDPTVRPSVECLLLCRSPSARLPLGALLGLHRPNRPPQELCLRQWPRTRVASATAAWVRRSRRRPRPGATITLPSNVVMVHVLRMPSFPGEAKLQTAVAVNAQLSHLAVGVHHLVPHDRHQPAIGAPCASQVNERWRGLPRPRADTKEPCKARFPRQGRGRCLGPEAWPSACTRLPQRWCRRRRRQRHHPGPPKAPP